MKRKLVIGFSSCLVFISIVSGILASVAWFAVRNNVDLEVTGSFVEAYFHCGTGTQNDPFVITRPIHYYHLVEFYQRITTLPSPTVHFGSDYLYFQVGYDLDDNSNTLEVYNYNDQGLPISGDNQYSQTLNMAYYSGTNSLMPIGTNEVPFIGVFDGKADEGIVISNLNIHCAERVKVGSNMVDRAASDIGVFGYVSDDDENGGQTIIKNTKIDGLTIDLSNINSTVASSTTDIDHLATHETGKPYVGYIAGHIHTYTNYDASGNTPTNASPLYNVYVDNATIKGGANTMCNYGYIGLVDTGDIDNTATISGMVSTLATGAGGGTGQGDDWGGSLDFKAFNQRIHDIFNTKTATYGATYYGYYQTDEMKLSFGRGGGSAANYLKQDQNTVQTYYLLQGDGDHYYSNSSSTKLNMPGTVMPLLANNDFSTNEKNTGYIIGDTRPNSNGKLLFDSSIRSSSYNISHIGNSLSDVLISESEAYNGSGNGANVSYSENSVEILTNSVASYSQNNFVLVKDTYNTNHTVSNSSLTGYTKNDNTTPEKLALEKYNAARVSLGTILDDSTLVHGLHFMDKDIAYNNTTSLTTAKLNGQTYNNYAFPKSCIDFHLKEEGKINFFGGSYYNAGSVSRADCFFSLSVIERNGNSLTSSSIKKISYIYKNTAYDKTNPDSQKYIYRYSDNSYSGSQANVGDLAFDMRYLSETPPVQNAIYYFEIPVNKGEYALHGVSGHDAGGYLMYLDIGASAGEEEEPTFNQENMISDSPLFTQIGFLKASEDFIINSCFNVAYVIPAGATKDNFSITISCGTETITNVTYTCYEVVITNTTGNDFGISALLIDDDDIDDDNYFYMYAITYNGGTRTEYLTSNSFSGTSGATTMTPTYGGNNNGS